MKSESNQIMEKKFSNSELKLRFETPWKTIWYFCTPPIIIMVIQGLYNILDKSLALKYATPNLLNDPWYASQMAKLNEDNLIFIDLENRMKEYINIATHYASQIYNLMWGFAIMAAIGCALNFSIAFGKRDQAKMRQIVGNGFIFSFMLSCLVAIVVFLLVYPGLGSVFINVQMGKKNHNVIIQQLAWEYTYPMIAAAPLMFLSYYFISIVRSEGRMKWTIAAIITSIIINCGVAIFFMKVCHFGITGAMLGTVFSWATQVIWGLIITLKLKDSQTKFGFHDLLSFNKTNFVNFIKIGFPNFLSNFALVTSLYISTSLLGKLSDLLPTNGNSGNLILQQLMSSLTPWMVLIISVGVGIAQGARTIIAYNYGAQKYQRIWVILKRTSILLFTWFTSILFILMLFGKQMIILFAFPEKMASKYHWWLVLNFMTYPFCAITYICITLFQGTNRSALSTFSTSLRSFVVLLPLILIGYLVAKATSNPIFYYVIVGLNDLICALILVPILICFWLKYRDKLVDVSSKEDKHQQINLKQ